MNEKLYIPITDILFRELNLQSYDLNRTFSNKEEMITEYARATVIEVLVEILLKISAETKCPVVQKICDDIDVTMDVSEERLKAMAKMQPPHKEMLMHMLVNNLDADFRKFLENKDK